MSDEKQMINCYKNTHQNRFKNLENINHHKHKKSSKDRRRKSSKDRHRKSSKDKYRNNNSLLFYVFVFSLVGAMSRNKKQ